MTTLKLMAVLATCSILTSSALAQETGFFVSAGGGMAKLDAARFVVYNPKSTIVGGEPLATTKTKASVGVVRLMGGYNVTENWAVQASYARYGTGEVEVAFPLYTGYAWGVGGGAPIYQRHVLKYQTTAITLLPTYTQAIGDKSRLIVGIGACVGSTASHFEETWIPGGTVAPENLAPVSMVGTEEKENSLGYVLSLGANRLITKNLSLEMVFNYTTFKMKVPTSPWASASKSSVSVGSLSAELALGWHW